VTAGCLVMAYGTPASPDEVEAYYTHIRRGRAPEPAQLRDLLDRYEAIGGVSPLREITEAQVAGIADALGAGWRVTGGFKHASPFIEDGAAALAAAGVDRIVGLVLAPHFSHGSVGEYASRLEAAAGGLGVEASTVRSWHDEPAWIEFQARAVGEALATLPERTKVLFTAHSLPERVLVDDPYPDELRASATAIAERAGLARWAGWSLAWQSAGRTSEAWRGPDILQVIDDLAGTGRADGVLVCPQGFTADHLEVLYDLDVQAAERAGAAGLAFARTRSLNADPAVLAALANRVGKEA
jgi:protoporphyrin/coproporphyrin ferrochelatase